MPASYITPDVLLRQPSGLSWQVVPTLTADLAEQRAQLALVCHQVTSLIDGFLHQPLRSVIVTEQVQFPGHPRASMDRHTGIVSLVTRQWPVTAVNAVQVSPARAFPATFSLVPAQRTRIRTPVLQPMSGQPVTGASGSNMIDIAPGSIAGRDRGRGALLISYSTTTGYPHSLLTAVAAEGAESLATDDVTGWAGFSGWILDGPATEFMQVADVTAANPPQLPGAGGTVQAGPGTLTLEEGLRNPHGPGALLTAMPLAALQAAALSAAVIALEHITAIAAQSSSGMLPGGLGSLAFESEKALEPFARIM